MPDASVRTPNFPVVNAIANTDTIVVNFANSTANVTSLVSAENLIGNTPGLSKLYLSSNTTPANSTATGLKGTIVWDSSYFYCCVANNTWKRSALSTW